MLYRSRDELFALYDDLVSSHRLIATKSIIGTTVEGRSIPMYKFGNLQGGKILLDSTIHGEEDMGGEIFLLYARWILESTDPDAIAIRNGNCTMIIPCLNVDRYDIGTGEGYGRRNAHDVDLSRNFTYRWEASTDKYKGPSPASEPETQALINIFKNEKPIFYLNSHNGDRAYFAVYSDNSSRRTYAQQVYSKIVAEAQKRGIVTYGLSLNTAYNNPGLAVCDADLEGINSFLIEWDCWTTTPSDPLTDCNWVGHPAKPPFSSIQNYYFPRWLPIGIVWSRECAIPREWYPGYYIRWLLDRISGRDFLENFPIMAKQEHKT